MKEALLSLAPSDLRALAIALRTGRLGPPYHPSSVQRFLSGAVAVQVSSSLQDLERTGLSSQGLSTAMDLLAAGFSERPALEDLVDLVTTGPEVGGVTNRDTSVVVRELFANAERSVLVAGYAVYQGQRVFQALADRMAERDGLDVRLFLDIQRKSGDTSIDSEIVLRFIHRFRTAEWPPNRPLPEVYYDPRSLAPEPAYRAALHAKCVVVDGTEVFVSSANFTEAAQQKNIEVGLLLRSATVADRIVRFFESLVESGHFERAL